MTYSMTGYGRGRSHQDSLGIMVEIKTVNHRYMDIFFRLPRELQSWEEFIREKVNERISRGRVEVSMALEQVPRDAYQLQVDDNLVSAYSEALSRIKGLLALEEPLTLDHLLRFTDIVSVASNLGEKEETRRALEEGIDAALSDLINQRKKEGEKLKSDLWTRSERLAKCMESVQEKAPQVAEKYRERLQNKLQELLGDGWDESKIITECALLAERSNIEEELTRCHSHLDNFKELLEAEEGVGRKMDFILQEMLREVNTIGSKANHYGIANQVVEAKSELEKMREQVQNIE